MSFLFPSSHECAHTEHFSHPLSCKQMDSPKVEMVYMLQDQMLSLQFPFQLKMNSINWNTRLGSLRKMWSEGWVLEVWEQSKNECGTSGHLQGTEWGGKALNTRASKYCWGLCAADAQKSSPAASAPMFQLHFYSKGQCLMSSAGAAMLTCSCSRPKSPISRWKKSRKTDSLVEVIHRYLPISTLSNRTCTSSQQVVHFLPLL